MPDQSIQVDIDTRILYGSNDANLKKIEAAFPNSRITARGNQIFVTGEAVDASAIDKVLRELSTVIKRSGKLSERDVDLVLALARTDEPSQPISRGDQTILHTPGGDVVRAKTANQNILVESAAQNDIVFAIGPAGTGKTYTAVALAVNALRRKQVKRIVLCRPAVEAGEQLGFLPGSLKDKVDPYLRPLYDALGDMMLREKLSLYLDQNTVEIVPLAYMRGRTLNKSFVILDEAQNATTQQMKMFLTRLGNNSRAIITGDVTQIDLDRKQKSGLVEAKKILTGVGGIDFVYFDETDVVRHRLVKDIIRAYEKHHGSPADR